MCLRVLSPFVGRCELIMALLDSSIEAPPSVLPQRHYCDITGLEVSRSISLAFCAFTESTQ